MRKNKPPGLYRIDQHLSAETGGMFSQLAEISRTMDARGGIGIVIMPDGEPVMSITGPISRSSREATGLLLESAVKMVIEKIADGR